MDTMELGYSSCYLEQLNFERTVGSVSNKLICCAFIRVTQTTHSCIWVKLSEILQFLELESNVVPEKYRTKWSGLIGMMKIPSVYTNLIQSNTISHTNTLIISLLNTDAQFIAETMLYRLLVRSNMDSMLDWFVNIVFVVIRSSLSGPNINNELIIAHKLTVDSLQKHIKSLEDKYTDMVNIKDKLVDILENKNRDVGPVYQPRRQ